MDKKLEAKFARWDTADAERLAKLQARRHYKTSQKWPPHEKGTQPRYDEIVKRWNGR
jgi:hypothetical protein